MKKGLLFTVLTCAFAMGLASCQQGGGGTPTPPEPVTYDVSITNKTALQAEWRVGDATRPVNVKIPGVVTAEALANGDLVIASNHTDILSIAGNQASPVSEGTARITATYKTEFSDYVDVTIQKAPVYKMATTLSTEKDYILAHKAGDGSGRLFSASNAISSGYYIGWEEDLSKAPVAKVVEDVNTTGDFKYSITLTTTSAEGEETTKTVGVAVTAKGKFAAGFDGEEVTYNSQTFTPAKASFKLDDQYRLVTKVLDTFDNNKEYELILGASGTYNTNGYQSDETKIANPTRLYELSTTEIPATSLTVTPMTVNLHPNGVQPLTVTYEPFDTTDNLSFESSDPSVAEVAINGSISAMKVGTATVTVRLGSLKQDVAVTVEGDPIEFGTKDNPLTVDQAVASLNAIGKNNVSPKPLYVKGTVKELGSGKDAWSDSYGNGAFWLADSTGAKKFELYRAVVDEEKAGVKGSEIAVGDEIAAYGYGTLFNTTYELTTKADGNPANPTIYEWKKGEPPVEPDPIEVTVAQAKTEAAKLTDATSADKYAVTGYITEVKTAYNSQYKNISVYIGDNVGDSKDNSLQAYRAITDDATAPKLVAGAQVKITGYLSNSTQYGMQIAEGAALELLKEAEAQPKIIPATVAEAQAVLEKMEEGAKTFDNYAVTGYIIKVDSPYNSTFGNVSVVIADAADATEGLLAYRAKCDAEAGDKAVVGAQVKVTGPLDKNSHGDQIAEGSALVILKDSPVAPVGPTEATVAEAIAAISEIEGNSGTTSNKYAVTGYIISVESPHSLTDNTASVRIGDTADADTTLLAYNVVSNAEVCEKWLVGAQIKVTGYLEKISYSPNRRIAAGATVEFLKEVTPDYKTIDVGNSYVLDGSTAGTGNAYANANKVVVGEEGKEVTWYVTGNTTTNPWRIGGKSLDKVGRRVYSADKMSTDFNKIEVEIGTIQNGITLNSVTIEVYSTFGKLLTEATGDVASLATRTAIEANAKFVFEKAGTESWANCYYSIVFNVSVSGSSNKYMQLKTATFSIAE